LQTTSALLRLARIFNLNEDLYEISGGNVIPSQVAIQRTGTGVFAQNFLADSLMINRCRNPYCATLLREVGRTPNAWLLDALLPGIHCLGRYR